MNKLARTAHRRNAGGHGLGGSAAPATEITFYYPIAVGGPITKIVDGYAAEFTQGASRHHREAGLYRQLSGLDRQGDDRGQGRQCAGRGGAAVHRHVFADRRRSDRAL